ELYAHAQKIVATLDEAWQVLAELREGIAVESGPLRIAADTTVGTYVLPALLADFRRWRPTSALQLRIVNRLEVRASLLAGEVDLVIAGRPPAIVGLQIIPFLTNPLVVVAASTHELARQQQIPLARLADETFLLREEGSGTRAAIEELFEVAGLPLKIGMVFGHIEAIKQAVAAGLGVSVLSEVAVRRELRSHKLAILQVEKFPLLRRWYIAHATQQPLSAQVGEFIEFLNGYSAGKSSV
ncbi:MAG TPA: LysR substrate-binding domain-containing protein, partial [Ktedonobacteraceae bacterium]|nr:LysR substrate-binding domain-containing protein [Ktedonobacteraceae bacterium]